MMSPIANSGSKQVAPTAKSCKIFQTPQVLHAFPFPAVGRRQLCAGMLPAAAALLPMPWRWWSVTDERTAAQQQQDSRKLAEERRKAAERAALRDRMGRYIR
uniref:Uncharacterized protein n=1 Tax=Tetradesmus obliquus TaxID=3088 RepID=A0A383VXK4_TETOB